MNVLTIYFVIYLPLKMLIERVWLQNTRSSDIVLCVYHYIYNKISQVKKYKTNITEDLLLFQYRSDVHILLIIMRRCLTYFTLLCWLCALTVLYSLQIFVSFKRFIYIVDCTIYLIAHNTYIHDTTECSDKFMNLNKYIALVKMNCLQMSNASYNHFTCIHAYQSKFRLFLLNFEFC